MNTRAILFIGVAGGISISACVHTPPGTSVEVALARKPELIKLPATPTPKPIARMAALTKPAAPDSSEAVADAFSRGEFCMKAGKDAEAIAAFREAVKADPKFSDAWTNLAILYEKQGAEKEALDAFKKSKSSPQRNTTPVHIE